MKQGSGSGLLLSGSRFWTRIRASLARILIPDPDPYIFVYADPGPSAAPDTLEHRFFDQFSEVREFIYEFFLFKYFHSLMWIRYGKHSDPECRIGPDPALLVQSYKQCSRSGSVLILKI
jgi:hypothetical protein